VTTRQGRFEAALVHFDACLALRPTFVPALLNAGSVHTIVGHRDRAVTHYRATLTALVQAHGLNVTTPPPTLKLGIVLGWLQQVIMRAFSPVPVGNDDDPAHVAPVLQMFLDNLARVDHSQLHLGLGMQLMEFGAFGESLRHIQEGLSLQVRGRRWGFCWLCDWGVQWVRGWVRDWACVLLGG
jgi:hypothetical protein